MKVIQMGAEKGIQEIAKIGTSMANDILKKNVESVVKVTKEPKGWKVIIEALERKSIPDTHDILGRYELELNANGELLGYKQTLLRRRSELKIEQP